jgi:hypothetical protein
MQKRGQLTIVLVLVVFMMLVLGISFYINSLIKEKNSEKAAVKSTSATLDAGPINEYVQSVFADVALAGIGRIGMYGGYISPEGNLTFIEDSAPFSNLIPDGTFIPYYIKNDAGFLNRYDPPLEDITEKLRRYIAYEILNHSNFTVFEDRGYVVQHPNVSLPDKAYNFTRTNVSFSPNLMNVTVLAETAGIYIYLDYPIAVSKREASTQLLSYEYSVPIPLKAIHSNISVLLGEIISNLPGPYDMSADCDKYTAAMWINTTSYPLPRTDTLVRFVARITPQHNFTFQFLVDDVAVVGKCLPP